MALVSESAKRDARSAIERLGDRSMKWFRALRNAWTHGCEACVKQVCESGLEAAFMRNRERCEIELRGGKAFERRAWAWPQRGQCQRSESGSGRSRQTFAALGGEQCARQGQALFAEAVGQQAVVADAHEASGQHVEEEAAQELAGVERHDALLAAVGIIPPAEVDALAVEGDQAVVGDGDAMGVAAEIAQHMFRSAEGRLGIDDPVLVVQLVASVARTMPGSLEISVPDRCNQAGPCDRGAQSPARNLLAEDDAQDGSGQQEQRMAGVDPALMVRQTVRRRERRSGYGNGASRFEPQVCRMERKPIWAPSRLGSAATSSRVWELASNSRS